MSYLKPYYNEILEIVLDGGNVKQACRTIKERHKLANSVEGMRKAFESLRDKNTQHAALEHECDRVGVPLKDVNHYWYKGEHFSIHVKNKPVSYDDIRDDLIDAMSKHSPKYPKIKRKPCDEPHLLVIDPADVHIGKLATSFETGEEYNNQIAVKRVKDGVQGILNKSSSYNIDKIIFVGGNDILHIDTPKRTTTSGTPQDTDGMWYDNFLIAKQLYVEVIEMLLPVADVHFMFNPSNHDYAHGFLLADVMKTWFRKNKNITFDCSISHRKYYKYGNNLIGTSHGDGAKMLDLPLLMAEESKQDWADTKHRYFYVHHLHHKWSKDVHSVCVEGLRSPSGTDSWHHRNGYQHQPKAIEGFIHHPEHGQVSRLTHIF